MQIRNNELFPEIIRAVPQAMLNGRYKTFSDNRKTLPRIYGMIL